MDVFVVGMIMRGRRVKTAFERAAVHMHGKLVVPAWLASVPGPTLV